MDAQAVCYLAHEARLMIADEYRLGLRDDQPLGGVMVRLLIQSLQEEHELELRLRTAGTE